MQILDNRNWEFPMGFTSRLIRKPILQAEFGCLEKVGRDSGPAINKRVPIWFVLNYIIDSYAVVRDTSSKRPPVPNTQ